MMNLEEMIVLQYGLAVGRRVTKRFFSSLCALWTHYGWGFYLPVFQIACCLLIFSFLDSYCSPLILLFSIPLMQFGRSKWNGNVGSSGVVMRVDAPLSSFGRPSFSVQINSGIEF